MHQRTSNAVIYSVVALAIVGVGGIVGLAAVAPDGNETLLMVIVGFQAPTIAALLGTAKAQENSAKLDRIDGRLNGELDSRIAAAVTAALTEYHKTAAVTD